MLFLQLQVRAELLKMEESGLQKKQAWIAALESGKHLYCYCSGEAKEWAHWSALLLVLFHAFFNNEKLLLGAIPVVAVAGT